MIPPLVAYYRVSTARQGRSGLGLEAQERAVTEYAGRAKRTISASYTELESGRRKNRPHLAAAIAKARASGATLVVAKLDRLARDVSLILRLVDSGVHILFLDLPELSADPIIGRLVLTIMAAIAEFEARRIGQRIREALAARRARGKRHRGFDTKQWQRKASRAEVAARRRATAEYRAVTLPLVEEIHAKLHTLTRTVDRLNAKGILTFTGKQWSVANLERFLSGR